MIEKKPTPRRLYLVTPIDASPEGQQHLVAATHPAVALAHVAREAFTVTVPTAMQVAALVAAGAAVKEA